MTKFFNLGLGILALILWWILLSTLWTLGSGDAAEVGLAETLAATEVVALWILLAVLATIALVSHQAPRWVWLPAAFSVPLSGYAAIWALGLLVDHATSPYRWPILLPAVVPPLILGFCAWVYTALPVVAVNVATWSATLVLCIATAAMGLMRDRAVRHAAATDAQWAADIDRLPPDAPLWLWTPFLASAPDVAHVDTIVRHIVHLDHRQTDAETMMNRGDFPFRYLGRFELLPTESLCEKARAALRKQAEALMPATPGLHPYDEVAGPVEAAANAMEWLVGYDCPCDAESRAWEATAKAYHGASWDTHRLIDLRDPAVLGRRLLERPDGMDLLRPDSPLRLYLAFATAGDAPEPALSRARRLIHRDDEAVEMLNDPARTGILLRYLTDLDLDASPALCTAAARAIDDSFARVETPAANEPKPYRDLIGALGPSDPLKALTWLVAHRCDANDTEARAEELVTKYEDSPDRAAMLSHLRATR